MRAEIQVAMSTNICTAVTTIFSIIIASFITWGKMCISSHAPIGKHQIKRTFMGHTEVQELRIKPASYRLAPKIWWQLQNSGKFMDDSTCILEFQCTWYNHVIDLLKCYGLNICLSSEFNLLVLFHGTRQACDISWHMQASLYLRPS